MSVHPCGTPAGMMTMSPVLTTFLTTSAPAMMPLHEGPFSTFVTSAVGADLRPLTVWPRDAGGRPTDRIVSLGVCYVRELAARSAPGGGGVASAAHPPAGGGAPGPPPPLPAPAAPPPVGPRWTMPTARFSFPISTTL